MLKELSELPVYERLDFRPVRGRGCYLWDAAGRRVLDLYAGHAVALTGHAHPRVATAVAEQAERLLFYSNALPLEPREHLLERLARLAPPELGHLFLVNSGAEANEQALALARRATGRERVVVIEGGFHGRTLATLACAGTPRHRELARRAGGGALAALTDVCPFGDTRALESLVTDRTAAVLAEPVQGLAGARPLPTEFLCRARELCDAAGAVLVFDEVQSGCGRTGAFTAAQRLGIRPDAITLAKGIASGLPLGVLLVSDRLAEGIGKGDLGSTFGGGPVPCAAAAATLAVLEEERLAERAREIGALIAGAAARLPGVREVRGAGLLLGLVLDRPAAQVQRELLAQGVLAGTSADPSVLRLLPPLVAGEGEAGEFLAALERVLT
ncbi:MAG: aminotransferase class III-fold pyridoxal phosphate-dependent enzyme [Acidobacteria bacterium]|nr:MAG: aminotransferase class III-fold pyridoxal phosphate-dependent enzyme [Acidobacteriota bacterium]